MATEDYTGFLSQQDRAKLARNIGVPIGDGRVFKRGVVVSAGDSQMAQNDLQRNSLLSQQTAGFRQSQEMLQREQTRIGQPSPQFLPPAGQAKPGMRPQMPGQPQQAPGVVDPVMLARANQISRSQSATPQPSPSFLPPMPSMAPQQAPAGAPAATAGQGSIMVNGQPYSPPQTPLAPPLSEQNMMLGTALARQDMRQNAPRPMQSLVSTTYSPQQLSQMTPTQVLTREAFDQQNAAKTQATQEADLKRRETESQIAKNTAPKPQDAFDVAYSSFQQSNPKATPEQTQKFIDDYRSKGANQTNVNVGEGLLGKVYTGYEKSRNDIVAADETLSTLDEAIKEIESGKAFTGAGAQFKLQGAKVAQLLGSEKFNDEIAATEGLVSTISQAALSQIQRLPGPASDKDIKFIQSAAAGSTGIPGKETLRRIREIMARTVERNKSRFQQDVDRAFTGDDQNAQFAKRALSLGGQPQGQQAPSAPAGQQAAQPLKIGRFTVIQQ